VRAALADPDPLVRLGALRGLAAVRPGQELWSLVGPLLDDPVRGVRIEAVGLLADPPPAALSPIDKARFDRAAADYVEAQTLDADRPEGRVNLANFLARQGRAAEAETRYLDAIRFAPDFLPAYTNLASLYAGERRDPEGERQLREALRRFPDHAGTYHALGLNLVRQQRLDEAVTAFGRAAELDPAAARYAYVQAIALNSTGRTEEALRVLEASHGRHPGDRDTLLALVTINRDRGDLPAARTWAGKLVEIDPRAQALLGQLQ
jgi:tetratricopeptide (TPR) repeat protein